MPLLLLLKFDHFRYPAIFHCQKAEMIKLWLNSIIWSHECASNPIIKCVEWSHSLVEKICLYFEVFNFSDGIQILLFYHRQLRKLLKTTYQSAFRRVLLKNVVSIHPSLNVSENTMEYFLKNVNYVIVFLVKQWKEASELKSIYRFKFFIIYAK